MEVGTNKNKFSVFVAETLGTTIFLACIFYTALYQKEPVAIALGVGGGLFIAITIFGNETGGHFNPAVSIGYYIFFAANKLEDLANLLILLIAQVCGGFLAGLILFFAADKDEPVLKPDENNLLGSFLDEVFFTTLFLAVIYSVKSKNVQQSSIGTLQALTVSLTLSLCVLYGGQISGACYNPAVGLSMNFWAAFAKHNRQYAKYVSYYIMAPIIGGLISGFIVSCFTGRQYEKVEENLILFKDEENHPLKSKDQN